MQKTKLDTKWEGLYTLWLMIFAEAEAALLWIFNENSAENTPLLLAASALASPSRPGREGSGNPRRAAWGGAAPCPAIADRAGRAPWCSWVSARRLLPAGCRPSSNPPPPCSLRRQPAPEGLPGRPRRDPFGPRRLHQPPLLPHRGGAQPASPGRQVPGAAGLPRPPAQRPRREGGGAQPGEAAALAGLRSAALPAGREAPGYATGRGAGQGARGRLGQAQLLFSCRAGGVPAAAPHDGDGRREVAEAAESAGGRRANPRGGWLAAARRDGLRGAPTPGVLPRGSWGWRGRARGTVHALPPKDTPWRV